LKTTNFSGFHRIYCNAKVICTKILKFSLPQEVFLRLNKRGEITAMKKIISTFLMLAVMAIMLPLSIAAQTYTTRRVYQNGRYRTVRVYKKPSFYRRHRNASNIAIGTGAGAIIGAIAGGKKGALIGSAIGAGGSTVYTYKVKPKKRRYYRRP
jgi:hypothetical protein